MPNIRPTVRRFGPVAPGGGAVIGAGLAGLGQALGAFADVQVEIDRLDQVQFEKVERSEAITQFTAKQIERNNTAAEILSKAQEGRNFESVQQDMNVWETSFNQNLFEGRSQEFRDVFETIDRPARNGSINKLGTAVEAGRLGIVRDNYQIAADNFVDSVNAFTTPAEINEFFDAYEETGIGLGFTQAAIDATSGESRRAAMEKHIRSLPLVDGLAALSDEGVAGALGEDGRERMRRDLNTKANTLQRAQEITSEAHAGVVGLDVLDALVRGESATALISRIRNDNGISPTRQKDMIDLVGVIENARAKGPQPISPDELRANHVLNEKLMKELLDERKELVEGKTLRSEKMSDDERQKALNELNERGFAILSEATQLAVQGQFNKDKLVGLTFQGAPLSEGMFVIDQERVSILERATRGAISQLGPGGNLFVELLKKRVPNTVVSKVRSDMFLGEGRYGGLDSTQRAVMGKILTFVAIETEGSGQPTEILEAMSKADEIFTKAEKIFMSEEFGLVDEAAEQAGGLIFNSGDPATEARQQPDVSDVADGIRENLLKGKTIAEIEEFARTQSRFSQEAFNRALATLPGLAPEPTLEQLGVSTR